MTKRAGTRPNPPEMLSRHYTTKHSNPHTQSKTHQGCIYLMDDELMLQTHNHAENSVEQSKGTLYSLLSPLENQTARQSQNNTSTCSVRQALQ